MTPAKKCEPTEVHCWQKEHMPCKEKKMLLQGVSARFLLWCSEFILAAFLIKPGQMAEVLSNVFITRPHSTNGYLPE